MPIAAIAFAVSLSMQAPVVDEVTVKGMRLFARCWRTPTGTTPYMIWTIGSRDDAPAGDEWVIRGEYVAFEGLPILPVSRFTKQVVASSPDNASGPMVEQPGGENAKFAVIRGHLERVHTLIESLALPDTDLVKSSRNLGPDFGTMHHFRIDQPLKLTTPSGLTIEIPKQNGGTKMSYGAVGGAPMLALLFKPDFGGTEDKLPKSPLWQKFGGPIDIDMSLKGIADEYSAGFMGSNYMVEAKGIAIKPGPVHGASIEIRQTVVLQSYPLDFRVPVIDSK